MEDIDKVFNKLSDRRNLYLISQSANYGYDTYDSAVVAAWNAEEAQNIDLDGYGSGSGSWTAPKNVMVTLIGIAEPGVSGIICASFNAG